MTTAIVSEQAEADYSALVKRIGRTGEPVDVARHATELARVDKSGAELLRDVTAERLRVREAAAGVLEDSGIPGVDAAHAGEAKRKAWERVEQAEAAFKSARDELEAARRELSDSQSRERSAEDKQARRIQKARQTLLDTAAPDIARRLQRMEAERANLQQQRDRVSMKPEHREQSASLAESIDHLQTQIAELRAAMLKPENFTV